jgi:glycosyltransferase involved in cell wall biosynthesis
LGQNKIVLITSGQPALNPRLVKEADALTAAGYAVTVIYQYWNDWGTEMDLQLLAAKPWKAIRVGGSPKQNKALYLVTRIKYKAAKILFQQFGFKYLLAERAAGRCIFLLLKEALRQPAQLYIAHNLAALPAAVFAAKKNKVKCGFDAEDFHRNEISDDPNHADVLLKSFLEEKYLPQTNYITASSLPIANLYQKLFPNQKSGSVLNVFPLVKEVQIPVFKINKPLKLVWFSQYIGLGRGLETVFEALGKVPEMDFELHLIGFLSAEMKQYLAANSFTNQIRSDKLIQFITQFDVGLATENSYPLNRDICLTNKIFSYMQAGLAVLASDTTAQSELFAEYAEIGKIYDKNSIAGFTDAINSFYTDPELVLSYKKAAFNLGQTTLNWETESQKFLKVVAETLAD